MTGASDADLLRRIGALVDAAPSVVRRCRGPLGIASAYLPGERIPGLRRRSDGRLEIHVVMDWSATVDQVETEVIEAVGDRWTDGPVDVMVDDIDAPDRAAITAGTDSSGSP